MEYMIENIICVAVRRIYSWNLPVTSQLLKIPTGFASRLCAL